MTCIESKSEIKKQHMKLKELLTNIQKYASTGIIDDALIPCYDQNGRWRGGGIRMASKHPSFNKICESILPEPRRTRASPLGPVLLTSVYWRSNNPLTLCPCEIKGSLVVSRDVPVHAANLRHIGGSFTSETSHRIYLPQLTTVGGGVHAMKGFKLMAPRLREVGGYLLVVGQIPPRIETVGGRLGAYLTFDFQANHLRHVGGALVATKAESVVAPLLESVGGGFLLHNLARRIHTPSLRFVGGDFFAETVTDMRAHRLRFVGGDLDTRSAVGYYHPELRVAGEWRACPGAREDWTKRLAARIAIRGAGGSLIL